MPRGKEEFMASSLRDSAAANTLESRGTAGAAAIEVPHPAKNLMQVFVRGDGRVETLERYGTLAARILISQIFLLSGVMKVMDPAGTAEQMAGRDMFWIPFFLWSAA